MKRWLPHPLLTPLLAVIWLLLNNSLAPGQVLLGLLLGWAIPKFTLAFWPEAVRIHKPWVVLRFAAVLVYDIVVANVSVAKLILAGPRNLRPLFVVVPLDMSDDFAISLLANTVCLTPGTVSAKLSADRKALLVHALDAESPDEVIQVIKTRFEAPLKEIFAC